MALAILGLALICCALAALLYAFSPINHSVEQVPVSPTFFLPPG